MPHDDLMPDQDAPYVNASVEHSPNPAVRLTAAAAYGLRESAILTYAAQTYSDIRAEIAWDASARWTLGLMGLFRHSEYDADMAPIAQQVLDSYRREKERWAEITELPESPAGFRFQDPGSGSGSVLQAGRWVAGVHGDLPFETQKGLLERLLERLDR